MQIIPIDEKGQLHEASNIRIDELNVLDMKFLEATLKPTLVVLYQDSKEARHVKTYEVNLKDKVGSDWQEAHHRWCERARSLSKSKVDRPPGLQPLGVQRCCKAVYDCTVGSILAAGFDKNTGIYARQL